MDNDGRLDLHTERALFWNDGTGRFIRKTGSAYPGAGAANWIDYDNDGYLDCFSPQASNPRRMMRRNNRDGTFTEVSLGILTDDPPTTATGGAARADYDNDGFLDVVFANRASNKFNDLYHNDGNGNHWMLVKLVGTASNRSAIGAKVRAQAAIWGKSVQQLREISGTPYAGDPRAHFGLGDATKVTTLRIEWPSGTVEEFTDVAANQILTVWEPPTVSAAVRADGAGELTIKAEPNRGWQIKASADLLNWQTLTTLTNTTVTFQFTDTAAAGMACRFYRVENE